MGLKNKLPLKEAFFSTILSSIALAILSIAFFNIRFFNPVQKALKDFSYLDVYFSEKFKENSKVNNDIVIVNIENHDREAIAFLLESVINSNPKVVGFDVILKEKSEHDRTDSLLAQHLNNKKIVTAFEIVHDSLISSDPFFRSQVSTGFVNFNFEYEEEVIREFQGISQIRDEQIYSFATNISKAYLDNERWNKFNYEQELKNSQFIKYYGNYDKFPVLTLTDFIGVEKKEFLKNKIVLLGYLGDSKVDSTTDITDKFWTPLNEVVAGKSDRDMYGVVIHANIINMLLKNDMVNRISSFWLVVLTIITIYISTIVYLRLQKTYKDTYGVRIQAYQLIFSVILLVISFWLLSRDILLSPFLIILGLVVSGSYFQYYDEVLLYLNKLKDFKFERHE